MENEEKRIRTIYIGKILFDHTDEDHDLTTEEIRNILKEEYNTDVHRQTVPSDIGVLQRAGMQIEIVKSSQNHYKLTKRNFSLAELKLLVSAVESSKFISKSKSKTLINKISNLAGTDRAYMLKRTIDVEGRIKINNEKIFEIVEALNNAITKKCKVSFRYTTYNRDLKKEFVNNGDPYVVSPFDLVWNGDNYYMIGWSDVHDEMRTFRVDRIFGKPTEISEQAAARPTDYNLDDMINTCFHMFNSPRRTVELICACDVINAIIDKFGDKVDYSRQDEDHFRIKVKVAVNHIFYSWVFGFGGKVKIEGPDDISAEYREMLLKALE